VAGRPATDADNDRLCDALLDVLHRIEDRVARPPEPVEWSTCGACGCLLASVDPGGCPSCRYWLTAALESEEEDESWE
jgi:hypothetical protein